MVSSEEKMARSLTAETVELIPYLPYLLQDFWELGSSPQDMAELISRFGDLSSESNVLDLACGKGAVSIKLAKEFGCKVKGIDLMADFIQEARHKAVEHKVSKRCTFHSADITALKLSEETADLVVFGAVGDVLGEPPVMLSTLKKALKPGGYLLIDDGYTMSEEIDYFSRKDWLSFIEEADMTLLAEKAIEKEQLIRLCKEQIGYITKRADELKNTHPEKSELFDSYIRSQRKECQELGEEILGVTFLLKLKS